MKYEKRIIVKYKKKKIKDKNKRIKIIDLIIQ